MKPRWFIAAAGLALGCAGSVEDARITTLNTPSACESDGGPGPMSLQVLGEEWARTGNLTEGGRGVTIVDFDGDGILDLFVPHTDIVSRLYLGTGDGGFTDVTSDALNGGLRGAFGSSAADFDGDGDFDLVVYRAREPVVLLLNDGSAGFTMQEHPEWDPGNLGCGGSASWADFDLDGDLDLFYGRLGRYNAPDYFTCDSALLRNAGDGSFENASHLLSPDVQYMRVMASGWHQIDDDPWPELYTIADLPEFLDGARLLDNDGGELTQLNATGTEVDIAGMGLAAGDLNEDGIVDFVVPGIDELRVLRSAGERRWVDIADAASLIPSRSNNQSVAWGGELVDLDNDGWLDLPMGYGTIPQSDLATQPDAIYRNRGDGTFEEVGASWGFDDGWTTRGFVVADLNRDGWLDMVSRELGGRVAVRTATCGPGHWLGVTLHSDSDNRFGVGARVEVDIDGRTLWREVYAGSTSFNSGGPPEVHFGLGEAHRSRGNPGPLAHRRDHDPSPTGRESMAADSLRTG